MATVSNAEIPPVTRLRLNRLIGDTVEFGRIDAIRLIGNSLIVTDGQALLHVKILDPATGAVRARFGRHGRGPGELLEPRWITDDGAKRGAWVFDYRQGRLILYDLEPTRLGQVRADFLLSRGTLYRDPIVKHDTILSNGYFAGHTLSKITLRGVQVDHLIIAPPSSGQEVPDVKGRIRLNRNRLVQHPRDGRFALVYQTETRIDLFDANGQYQATSRGPIAIARSFRVVDPPKGAPRLVWSPDNEFAYIAAAASSDHIFALFCGRCGSVRPTEIHVYTWAGDLVARFALEQGISTLEVSEDEGLLWGDIETPQPLIGEWKLPPLSAADARGDRFGPPFSRRSSHVTK